MSALGRVYRIPRAVLISGVRGYRRWISPLTGPQCKYHPTCSAFALEALEVHGAVKGSALSAWRVARCNPWSYGGVDDVPLPGQRLFRLSRNNTAMMASTDSDRPVAST